MFYWNFYFQFYCEKKINCEMEIKITDDCGLFYLKNK